MPTTAEAALVLLVLIAPGFIASQVKNLVVPHRPPSAVVEAVQAVVISAALLPAWLCFAGPLLWARREWLAAWNQHAVPIQWAWATASPVAAIVVMYFIAAPVAGVCFARVVTSGRIAALPDIVVRWLGVPARHPRDPEIWDKVFGTSPHAGRWCESASRMGLPSRASSDPLRRRRRADRCSCDRSTGFKARWCAWMPRGLPSGISGQRGPTESGSRSETTCGPLKCSCPDGSALPGIRGRPRAGGARATSPSSAACACPGRRARPP